ncbi:unnamed protein product [Thelazia callipaeda]|uniref:Synembryn-A n=1 Tax=Thelazia callipaeda TaxID=103827 RepID=A0A0N5D647_THECL|nr:unnamed protein product [Thelazia callipaeda]
MDDVTEEDILQWQQTSVGNFIGSLKRINDNFEGGRTFDLFEMDRKHQIQSIFCERFHESSAVRQEILRFLRISARDKNNLDELLSSHLMQKVLAADMLVKQSFQFDWEVFIQAEMCLINLLFNSNLARHEFSDISSKLLLQRISLCTNIPNIHEHSSNSHTVQDNTNPKISECEFPFKNLNNEQVDLVTFYDLRIAFVASAYSKQLQLQWLKNGGCEVYLRILEQSLQFPERLQQNSKCRTFLERTNWTLKILFNIFSSSSSDIVEPNAEKCIFLCSKFVTLEKVDSSIEQSSVDIIAVMPLFIELLVPKLEHLVEDDPRMIVHNGRDMTFTCTLLQALKRRLDTENNEEIELLGTFLTVLISLCSRVQEVRRYLRLQVIPPLHATDVERRPDEGNELRNRMIRLMMSMSITRDLAAEFIFILCKRNVNRFVKYCGFGHAAGLLVNRGILGALNASRHLSDSESSETEDYKAVEAQINPVTGCIESTKMNPFAGMADDQKEYEVHRLMSDINELMNKGVITPGQVDNDGHLRPVNHVLELVKGADMKNEKSDSDNNIDI